MIATQFWYTLCFVAMLVGLGFVLLFFLCAGPDQNYFVKLIRVSNIKRTPFDNSTISHADFILIPIFRSLNYRQPAIFYSVAVYAVALVLLYLRYGAIKINGCRSMPTISLVY